MGVCCNNVVLILLLASLATEEVVPADACASENKIEVAGAWMADDAADGEAELYSVELNSTADFVARIVVFPAKEVD